MNTAVPAAASDAGAPRPTPWFDYRTIWRWHFYAAMFCIPFVIILSITGAIYLFKPQIESWMDRPYRGLLLTGAPVPADEQIRAALAATPGGRFKGYELPAAPNDAVQIIVAAPDGDVRHYVHPQSTAILASVPEQSRLMRIVFRIHGELMAGNVGSYVVELAASWTIVMILSGLYLWWPRNAKGFGGIIYPRLRKGSRVFWRDIHAVTGVWVSAFALLLLVSGLPWAKFWGDYLKQVRHVTGTAVARQDWSNGSEPAARPAGGGGGEHAAHGASHAASPRPMSGRRVRSDYSPADFTPVDRIAATVAAMNLLPPVVIAPPDALGRPWSAKSMTANRPQRVDLTLDDQGTLLSRRDFSDRHLIDKIVAVGIALHEGQLFGWPNQLLGLLTACGLVLLCVSSVIMWWKRRATGSLGALPPTDRNGWRKGLVISVVLLGVYVPLFGVSLLIVRLLEWVVLRRIGSLQRWLGLRAAAA